MPKVMGTARRTSPRGTEDCASASFSAASPSAKSRVARSASFCPASVSANLREVAGRARKGPQFHDFRENSQRLEIGKLRHGVDRLMSFLETMNFDSFYF